MRAATSVLALAVLAAPASALAARDAVIELHMGYGTPRGFVVTGRVIDDRRVRLPAVHRTASDNLIDSLKVLGSDVVAGALVELEIEGLKLRARTDKGGNFEVLANPLPRPLPLGDVPLRARLLDGKKWRAPVAKGAVRVLSDDVEHVAVLSDYDDTVVESGATNKIALALGALFRNAAQIKPVPGVSLAYQRALEAGAEGMFFLSGSPLHFHPRVSFFLEKNGIPQGPLLLKDFGKEDIFKQKAYKRGRLERLLEVLPKTRFVLVGDSGEHDPEIYAALRAAYPDRVAGIIIRRVKGDRSPPERFRGMTVVEHYAQEPDVLARYVRRGLEQIAASRAAAPAAEGSSEGEVRAEVEGAEQVDVGGLGVDAAHAHPRPLEEGLAHPEREARPKAHGVSER